MMRTISPSVLLFSGCPENLVEGSKRHLCACKTPRAPNQCNRNWRCPDLDRRSHSHRGLRSDPRQARSDLWTCKASSAESTWATPGPDSSGDPPAPQKAGQGLLAMLAQASTLLPYAVLGSALLSLFLPTSFAWFDSSYFAPALGFLMFSVGINTEVSQFQQVFRSPQNIAVGAIAQWLVKPALGLLIASTVVRAMQLPQAVATGIILVSCVSGAQLASYATFLSHPEQAPLSIVLTALSTAVGVFMTPLLALVLLGARLPVNAPQMAVSIFQIVVAPVAAGLLCNTYLPRLVAAVRPVLPALSLIDTCCCVGASLTGGAVSQSPIALQVLVPIAIFHSLAFWIGYQLAAWTVAKGPEGVPLARAISLQSGMQSSLLALLLSTRFFADPLVRLPCGISVTFMTLSGFGLVLWWRRQQKPEATPA